MSDFVTRRLISCIILLAILSRSKGQTIPDFGPVFPQHEVTSIYITIHPDSLNWMISNLENEHEFPATFVFESQSITDTVTNIGLRLRGNTSLTAAKKSFKISFNTFDTGGDWQGLEKLNLLATVNDPSLMRSKLSHDLYRKYGIAAARTSYTRLYINNDYRGLYLNVEQIDEEMTSTYFDGQGDGNLYKCTYPADLDYISNNPDDYKFALWGTRHYELKTNEYVDDYSDLSTFITVLNNTPAANLSCAIPQEIHISEYLKIAAIDILLGHWDNHIFLKNNFYLYHDQLTDRFRFIPFDFDNTLGIDWIGNDWSTRSLYNWSQQGEERPLYTRIIANNEYRDLFSKNIEVLCDTYFHPDTIAAQIEHWQNLIAPHIAEDPYYPIDFGFDMEDFYNAPTESCCNHVPFGILAYVEARRASALQQLESYVQVADAQWITQRIDTNSVSLRAQIDGPINSVQANYSWDGISYSSGTMTGEGNTYTYEGPVFNTAHDKLYYRTILNGSSAFPCTPDFHWMTRSEIGVRINEVCASNQSIIADNANEYDDWVELYNTTTSAISLTNCYLTDDPANWNRWQLPDTLLPANGFLLFWLDDDMEQGRQHANFKLGAGEELMMYRIEEGKPRIMDRASGFSAVADQTWALIPDGGSQSIYTTGTPGQSNAPNEVEHVNSSPGLPLFPCPANSYFIWPSSDLAILTDLNGRILMHEIHEGKNDCSQLVSGTYFVKSASKLSRLVIVR